MICALCNTGILCPLWFLTLFLSTSFLIFRVGRRPILLFSVIFILIFGLTVALSVNVTMFSTLRFFEGFCLAGIVLSLYALREYTFIPHPNVYLQSIFVLEYIAVLGHPAFLQANSSESYPLKKASAFFLITK